MLDGHSSLLWAWSCSKFQIWSLKLKESKKDLFKKFLIETFYEIPLNFYEDDQRFAGLTRDFHRAISDAL